jgi:RecB family exonuclease
MAATIHPAPRVMAEKSSRRDYLSFSAVSLFAACPLRFYFRYIAGLSEDALTASLMFGAAFHAGVEWHFRELLIGRPGPDIDALLAVFWDTWHARAATTIRFTKGEDINTVGQLADRMFAAFQKSAFARPNGTIIGIEEELRGELIPGLPDLLARVDLLVDSGDALELTDFKTSRTRWDADDITDSASQLLLYHELAKNLADGRPLRLRFAVLTKAKSPELSLFPVEADEHQIERTKQVVYQVWRAIQSGHFYPSPSPIHCPTCPYRAPCRAWTG